VCRRLAACRRAAGAAEANLDLGTPDQEIGVLRPFSYSAVIYYDAETG